MHFSTLTILLGLAVSSLAAIADVESVRKVDRAAIVLEPAKVVRAAAAAQTPTGNCCFANKSLKEDLCTDANGNAGKCVPGGPVQCGGQLNCVRNEDLNCNPNIPERSGIQCRFKGTPGQPLSSN